MSQTIVMMTLVIARIAAHENRHMRAESDSDSRRILCFRQWRHDRKSRADLVFFSAPCELRPERTNFLAISGTGKQVAGILIVGLCALAAGRALADCASECAYTYGGYGTYNYTTCYQLKCTNKKSFGATSDAYGYSWGKSSAGEAQQTAMVNCRANGNDCKIVADFSNACAAVAAVEAKNRFTVGQGNSRADAQNNALKNCGSQIGGKCEIEVWTCSTP
jgi:hypothetical protein